jgi:hypothetical protein
MHRYASLVSGINFPLSSLLTAGRDERKSYTLLMDWLNKHEKPIRDELKALLCTETTDAKFYRRVEKCIKGFRDAHLNETANQAQRMLDDMRAGN